MSRPQPAQSQLRPLTDAETHLLNLHQALFPERYGPVPVSQWSPQTLESVAVGIEAALEALATPGYRPDPQA